MSSAQHQFARLNDATPGPEAVTMPGARFMYGRAGTRAARWLVGVDGHVLEVEYFG